MKPLPSGKVVVWRVEDATRYERWPVDARGMVESGEYSFTRPGEEPTGDELSADSPTEVLSGHEGHPDGTKAEDVEEPGELGAPATPPAAPVVTLAGGGYRIEQAGKWYTAHGPEGQIGNATEESAEAWSRIPATFRPGGEPSLAEGEHSPGVPLEAGGVAAPAGGEESAAPVSGEGGEGDGGDA